MSVTEIKTYRITCDFMVKGQGFSGKQDMVPCGNGVTVTGTNESVLESLNKLGWTRVSHIAPSQDILFSTLFIEPKYKCGREHVE